MTYEKTDYSSRFSPAENITEALFLLKSVYVTDWYDLGLSPDTSCMLAVLGAQMIGIVDKNE